MKMIYIFSLKEEKNPLGGLIEKIGVSIYSELDVQGVYTGVPAEASFIGSHKLKAESKLDIIACNHAQAESLMEEIKKYNATHPRFPMHAYCLNIESHVL
ncbi:hypothetical protein N9L20_02070 [Flavobacteriaceae bacterium]|nr:hypothetical protein [Flavobacteriaceae bacterium]